MTAQARHASLQYASPEVELVLRCVRPAGAAERAAMTAATRCPRVRSAANVSFHRSHRSSRIWLKPSTPWLARRHRETPPVGLHPVCSVHES